MKERIEWLHGLRGAAVAIVLLGHFSITGANLIPGVDLNGTAKSGVWLFFILSAYLLARPLTEDMRAFGAPAVMAFYVKRVFRILPLYFTVLIVLVATGQIETQQALLHAAFVRGDFHLWTMPVEMAFYLVLPLFAAFGSQKSAILALAGSAVLFVLADPGRLAANSILPLNYAIFFGFGIMVAYLRPPRPLGSSLPCSVSRSSQRLTSRCLANGLASQSRKACFFPRSTVLAAL